MKTKKQKAIAAFLLAILIAFIPLVVAAPVGTSETTTLIAAKSWIGVKALHGGNDRSSIDCSHLVYQVYKQVRAKSIVFQTVPKMKKNKYYVTTTSPRPGDVIFWKKDVTKNEKRYYLVNHVGIYMGNGQFIHPSDETMKVTTDSISGMYKDGIPYYARWCPASELLINSGKTNTAPGFEENEERFFNSLVSVTHGHYPRLKVLSKLQPQTQVRR